jgi:hypothetical protein
VSESSSDAHTPDYPPEAFVRVLGRECGFITGDIQQLWEVAVACARRRARLGDSSLAGSAEGAAEVFSFPDGTQLTAPGDAVEFLVALATGSSAHSRLPAGVLGDLRQLLDEIRSLDFTPDFSD